MNLDKANITTYMNGVLLAIFAYIGVSETTADIFIQILAPILSIAIAGLMSYYNEKYPSNLVTRVKLEENEEDGI